jgi:hypothetical protein
MTRDPEELSDQLARDYRKRCLSAWVSAASQFQRNDLVVVLLDRTDGTAQEMLKDTRDTYELVDQRVAIGVVTRSSAQAMLREIGELHLATGLEAHPAPTVCTIVFAYDILNVVGWTNAVAGKPQAWELASAPSSASPPSDSAEGGS